MKGDVRVNTEPRQLYDSVTDMHTSQVRVCHVLVLTADHRTDLVGCPLLYVHPTISMTPCTVNVTDEDLVKSAMKLDDSEAMLLFVAWGSDEDLRYITMFPEVLSIDTTYGTNREKRPLLVFSGTNNTRKNFTALCAFLPSEYEWVS
jgi:hypothetical protein